MLSKPFGKNLRGPREELSDLLADAVMDQEIPDSGGLRVVSTRITEAIYDPDTFKPLFGGAFNGGIEFIGKIDNQRVAYAYGENEGFVTENGKPLFNHPWAEGAEYCLCSEGEMTILAGTVLGNLFQERRDDANALIEIISDGSYLRSTFSVIIEGGKQTEKIPAGFEDDHGEREYCAETLTIERVDSRKFAHVAYTEARNPNKDPIHRLYGIGTETPKMLENSPHQQVSEQRLFNTRTGEFEETNTKTEPIENPN